MDTVAWAQGTSLYCPYHSVCPHGRQAYNDVNGAAISHSMHAYMFRPGPSKCSCLQGAFVITNATPLATQCVTQLAGLLAMLLKALAAERHSKKGELERASSSACTADSLAQPSFCEFVID